MKDPKITRPVGVNKDGYASGGVKVEESSQNLHLDPRSQIKYQRKKLHCSR